MTVENRKILIIEDNKDELRALVSHFREKMKYTQPQR